MGIIALLNPLVRVNGALKSEITIGNKILKTPSPISKIKGTLDFNIICDNIELEKVIKAICFDLYSVSGITQKRREKSKQYNLKMRSIDKNYDSLINNVPIIIDPNTEAFYFKIPWKNKRKTYEVLMNQNNKTKVYIRPEDALEFIYELSDKWKKEKDPIETMKSDLKNIIRYFKEEKFDKLYNEFKIEI